MAGQRKTQGNPGPEEKKSRVGQNARVDGHSEKTSTVNKTVKQDGRQSRARASKKVQVKPATNTSAEDVRPLDAREIKKIFSRSTPKQRKGDEGVTEPLPVEETNPTLPARPWKTIFLVFGPSVLLLLAFALIPGMRETIFGNKTSPVAAERPTNLLPTRYDDRHHATHFFASNQIVAYYGHPQARWMGIVGRYPKETLGPMLRRTAASYDRLNGSRGTVPAFYLIWGSAQPRGEIQFLDKSLLESYIRYTATNGFLLILDHQIGKYGPVNAVEQLLPFLRYPHIHLAIDPEWRTLRPMKEIGYVTGEELNQAQALMKQYMLTNRIPGKRMLIVHQFEDKMYQRRELVRSTYDPVLFVHSVSGWGSPSMKLGTWGRHSLATNLPHKAFKLWYYPGVRRPGLHYDYPLMTHQAVLSLRPSPVLIIYQ